MSACCSGLGSVRLWLLSGLVNHSNQWFIIHHFYTSWLVISTPVMQPPSYHAQSAPLVSVVCQYMRTLPILLHHTHEASIFPSHSCNTVFCQWVVPARINVTPSFLAGETWWIWVKIVMDSVRAGMVCARLGQLFSCNFTVEWHRWSTSVRCMCVEHAFPGW